MRIALVSDIHIHDWSEFRVIEDGVPSRLSHGVGVLADVRAYCNEHDIDVIAIIGDVFHKRNVIYTRPYRMVVEELQAMKRDGKIVLAVTGNHDQADKEGTVSTIDTFAAAELVTHAVPPEHGWATWEFDDLTIHGFNYCDNRELLLRRVDEALSNAAPAAVQIGLFHHGFKGARVGSALEYIVKEDVDPGPLGNAFDFIFSGHYHGRQSIGELENALYLGSPMQHTRGEGREPKGFTVYDSKTNTATLVPIDRPRFVRVTQELLAAKPDKAKRRIRGNFVDFHYEVWDPHLHADLIKLGAAGVKLVPLRRSKITPDERRLEVDPTLSVKTVLKRYIKYRKDDVKHLDQTELLRIGLDLYNSGEE